MKLTKRLFLLIATALLFVLNGCDAQVKNAQTRALKVYGNCGMCKKTIEKAANKKGIVKADWDVDTKILSLTFDSTQTDKNEILKRIAEAGYDNEQYRAPDKAYANLHSCCQYERMEIPPPSVDSIR